jgi:AraC-like DNA-binding protein
MVRVSPVGTQVDKTSLDDCDESGIRCRALKFSDERWQMESRNILTVFPVDSTPQNGIRRPPSGVALERHYSVGELAERWGLSERTIRRIFSKEPGVLQLTHEETRSKRGYSTLRIPESVVQRVHRRLRVLRDTELREQAVCTLVGFPEISVSSLI